MPEIQVIKKELLQLGAWGALMSGSGPTVFGVIGSRREAEYVATHFRPRYPDVFVARTITGESMIKGGSVDVQKTITGTVREL